MLLHFGILLCVGLCAAEEEVITSTYVKGWYSWCFDAVTFLAFASGALAAILFTRKVAVAALTSTAKKTDNKIDDVILVLTTEISHLSICSLLALVIAGKIYSVDHTLDAALIGALAVGFAFNAVRALERALEFITRETAHGKKKGVQNALYDFLKLARLLLYGGSILFALDNVGLHVSALLGVVGIGGMAVAMGAKDMISDILAAVAIFIDQPFEVGDLVSVSGTTGHIEEIGLRSTKIRALSGESHVMCNSSIAKAKLMNFSGCDRQNKAITIGVGVNTANQTVDNLPEILRDACANIDKCELDQIYLKELGEYSINFELRYSVLSNAPSDARMVLSAINNAVNKRLRAEDISMPFPTRVTLNKSIGSDV